MKKIKQKMKKWMMVGVSGAIALAMGSVAFAQEMVKDPSTGRMIKAPQYGGTITYLPDYAEPIHADTWWGTGNTEAINLVLEKLSIGDWAIPRDKWDYKRQNVPFEVTTGLLAESYETPDPLTIIAHIRKGIHWHNKAPNQSPDRPDLRLPGSRGALPLRGSPDITLETLDRQPGGSPLVRG